MVVFCLPLEDLELLRLALQKLHLVVALRAHPGDRVFHAAQIDLFQGGAELANCDGYVLDLRTLFFAGGERVGCLGFGQFCGLLRLRYAFQQFFCVFPVVFCELLKLFLVLRVVRLKRLDLLVHVSCTLARFVFPRVQRALAGLQSVSEGLGPGVDEGVDLVSELGELCLEVCLECVFDRIFGVLGV